MARLARLLRADRTIRSDVWPIWLGLPFGVGIGPFFHVPLPVKCVTEFLEPVSVDHVAPEDAGDPAALRAIYDEVTTRMQEALDRLAVERAEHGVFA